MAIYNNGSHIFRWRTIVLGCPLHWNRYNEVMVMGAGAGKTRQAASTSIPEYLSNGSIIPQFLDGGETNQILDHFHGLLKNLCHFAFFWYNRLHQQPNGAFKWLT
jgi:hypothetical protein